MKLIIITGRSGSGKSGALNLLEDAGYYCIDNLPAALLPELIRQMRPSDFPEHQNVAVCIDARNTGNFASIPELLDELDADIRTEIIFLDANSATLIKRFSETRRKHPLSSERVALKEAIEREKELLAPLAMAADLTINTSHMSVHELRDIIRKRVVNSDETGMAIMFVSFGFKGGVPIDADFVYDVRCLPNPHWVPELRHHTGLEQPIQTFLEGHDVVGTMLGDIRGFLDRWLPAFAENNRSYMTIAIGCTGGMHRSVFMVDRLCAYYAERYTNVQVHHRELNQLPNQSPVTCNG